MSAREQSDAGMLRCSTALGTVAPHELPQAARVLARAFVANPALIGLLACDDVATREQILFELVLGFCRVTHRYGTIEVVRSGATLAAVSLAFGPGAYPLPLAGQLRTAWAVLRNRPRAAHRFERFERRTRQKHPLSPHWYLWFLGVEPALQGRGLGSHLLRALSQRAARDAPVACYLETDLLSSVRLYQRHGYVVNSSEHVPGADTQMWFMERSAAPAHDPDDKLQPSPGAQRP